MQRPLQITARDFALSAPFEEEIREKATKLETYYERLTGCHVTVEAPIHHHRKGGPFKVRIDMRVPGGELAVTRQSKEGLAAAIREAFDAARRRLEDYARTQRREVKAHEPPPVARVTRLFPLEGYGFLETQDGREIYFHRNSVLEPGFDHLKVGMEVRFAEELGEKGPQASTVTVCS